MTALNNLLTLGNPRLRLWNPDGTVLKTLLLPECDPENVRPDWAEKATHHELINGDERDWVKGYVPILKLKWANYPDCWEDCGLALGTGDGQCPGIWDLLQLTSGSATMAAGLIGISAGPSCGGFRVNSVGQSGLAITRFLGTAKDLELTFRGRTALPSKMWEPWT